MPYAPSANSTKIDQFIDKIAKQLESVERYFIMLAALVYAADEVGFFVPENWGKDGDKTPARERYFALVSMAREKAQDVARELDASFRLLTERGMFFADVFEKGDANAKVDEAIDEALFALGNAGTQPLILLFDEEEIKQLGENPLARLVALQESAIELFKPQTVEAAGEASEVLAEALELTKLLAEGAESRNWSDDDEGDEGDEGEGEQEPSDDQELGKPNESIEPKGESDE
ncbi:MAG TPA: hypothetical protein VH877_26130 [Polyangia bacterium]|jgi:hypothetical protein|nr:hypothetical protein [Polyangia bacterium]